MRSPEIFRITIPVRVTDINYGNHLGNDSLVSILHEARMRWLHSHSLGELDAGGAGMIMVELHVQYKAEAFFADELEVILSRKESGSRGFTLGYLVQKRMQDKIITVAEAETKMLCYNYDLKKVVALPQPLVNALHA